MVLKDKKRHAKINESSDKVEIQHLESTNQGVHCKLQVLVSLTAPQKREMPLPPGTEISHKDVTTHYLKNFHVLHFSHQKSSSGRYHNKSFVNNTGLALRLPSDRRFSPTLKFRCLTSPQSQPRIIKCIYSAFSCKSGWFSELRGCKIQNSHLWMQSHAQP